MKTCTKCGKSLNESEFNKERGRKDGLRAQCKSCMKEYMAAYFSNSNSSGAILGKFHRLKNSAQTKGITFTIDPHTFVGWYRLQKMVCHYCGSPLTYIKGHKHHLSDKTFDRKDPKQGYSLRNIVLCCRRCNMIKGNWFTEEQMLEIASKYLRNRIP